MDETIKLLLKARSAERAKPPTPNTRITIAAIEVAVAWAAHVDHSEARSEIDAERKERTG